MIFLTFFSVSKHIRRKQQQLKDASWEENSQSTVIFGTEAHLYWQTCDDK